MSARNSAAPLIGQLRVMSWSRLVRIEETANQVFADGRGPIGRSAHLLDDDALAIDHEAFRDARGLVELSDFSVPIVQNGKCQAHLLHERVYDGRVLLVDADGDEREIRPRQPVMQ